VQHSDNMLERLREFDENRPSFPGEHWLAFGAGVYFLVRNRPAPMARLGSRLLGAALIARALSGRDGALAVLRRQGLL
jgi:hypothetical protein